MSDYENTARVDHPKHYGGADDPYETVKVLQNKMTPQAFAGYLEGCARKYLDRHLHKEGFVDVEKALWFVDRLHKFLRDSGYDAVYPSTKVDTWSHVPQSVHVHVKAKSDPKGACENVRKSALTTTVHVLATNDKHYQNFHRAVARTARVSEAEAAKACHELGYSKNGRRLPSRAKAR